MVTASRNVWRPLSEVSVFRIRPFTKFIIADPTKPEATFSRGILVVDQSQLFLIL